jgi:O-antigen biosynthesis protein WbqP
MIKELDWLLVGIYFRFLIVSKFNKMLSRFFALILSILFSPIFLIVFITILIEDGFPVFFTQKRVGINYSFFNIYKFRTMKKNTPNVATHLLENPDKYLLKIGKFIRKTSLDELPNLINILKGEMVFVGPRPALYNQDDLMSLRVASGVDKLKPGITGWAQINGRDEISIPEKVKLEQEYLEKKSFLFDFEIVIKTFTSVLGRKGVSH